MNFGDEKHSLVELGKRQKHQKTFFHNVSDHRTEQNSEATVEATDISHWKIPVLELDFQFIAMFINKFSHLHLILYSYQPEDVGTSELIVKGTFEALAWSSTAK